MGNRRWPPKFLPYALDNLWTALARERHSWLIGVTKIICGQRSLETFMANRRLPPKSLPYALDNRWTALARDIHWLSALSLNPRLRQPMTYGNRRNKDNLWTALARDIHGQSALVLKLPRWK